MSQPLPLGGLLRRGSVVLLYICMHRWVCTRVSLSACSSLFLSKIPLQLPLMLVLCWSSLHHHSHSHLSHKMSSAAVRPGAVLNARSDHSNPSMNRLCLVPVHDLPSARQALYCLSFLWKFQIIFWDTGSMSPLCEVPSSTPKSFLRSSDPNSFYGSRFTHLPHCSAVSACFLCPTRLETVSHASWWCLALVQCLVHHSFSDSVDRFQ